jgi:C-terminal peptidase prc
VTILVAAEQQLRDTLLPVLAKKGYTLIFVQDCDGIGTLVRTHPLDLIIVDIDMMANDSFRASTELKAALETTLIPVIALQSARATPRLKALAKFLRHRAVAVIDRPVDTNQLEREVARALGEDAPAAGCLTELTLSRLIDGELSQEETDRAHDHLARCRTCSQRFEEWKTADALFRDSFRTVMMTRMHSSKDCISPKKLTAYFRNGLPAAERAQVEAHLSRCAFCTRELVALYKLMKEFDEKQLEPLGEEMLHRLKSGMRELLRKAKGPLVCIHCVGSIPLGSATCPQCGAPVRGKTPEKTLPAPKQVAEGHDGNGLATRPNGGYVGSRKVQVAASLFGLTLLTSAVLAGIVVHQNRDLSRSARVAIDGSELEPQTGEDSGMAALFERGTEGKIEVFGQIAMYEPRTRRFDVPENVNETARALIAQHYYDAVVGEKALQHDDIWHVFGTLNAVETKGSTAPLLPRTRNRILGPDELLSLRAELSGSFSGLGVSVRLSPERDGEQIIGFTPRSPAREAGLQVGDVITEIDGTSLRGLNLPEMTNLGRGPAGTEAVLSVRRQERLDFEVRVPRRKSRLYVVEHRTLSSDIAYVRAYPLARPVVEKLNNTLVNLKRAGVEKVILDLRGNTGGSLHVAVDIAALFLPEGAPIARMRSQSGEQRFYSQGGNVWDGPLAVLVDNHTLSGAELIAAALQGSCRALIVGESTAGKAGVQTIYKLPDDYAVQLTTGVLVGADEVVFENRGVDPDIELVGVTGTELSRHYTEIPENAFIQAAFQALENGIATQKRRSSGS